MGEAVRITNYHELIEAMRCRKAALGLSDKALDEITGLADGHCGKVLGPARVRGLGAQGLDDYMVALAFDLVLVPSAEKLAAMKGRHERAGQRASSHVRNNRRVAKSMISRVMTEMRRKGIEYNRANGSLGRINQAGGKARMAALTPEQRQELCDKAAQARQVQVAAMSSAARSEAARKAIKARWEKRKEDGDAEV